MRSEIWKILRSRTVYENKPWLQVQAEDVELPDGRIVEGYLRLETPDFVMIVPHNQDNEIGLIRSYKHGLREIDLQPPAGYLEEGEDPLQAAKRELLEETGCEAMQWQLLGAYVNSGNRGAGRAHFFLATDCHQIVEPNPMDLEVQELVWMAVPEVKREWREGRFKQVSSMAVIGLALEYLENRQDELTS
jgi:ADP-ribose pyrophosphatase